MLTLYTTAMHVNDSASLAEQERQLVIELLRLYRDGGSFATIQAKLGELRFVRKELGHRRVRQADKPAQPAGGENGARPSSRRTVH